MSDPASLTYLPGLPGATFCVTRSLVLPAHEPSVEPEGLGPGVLGCTPLIWILALQLEGVGQSVFLCEPLFHGLLGEGYRSELRCMRSTFVTGRARRVLLSSGLLFAWGDWEGATIQLNGQLWTLPSPPGHWPGLLGVGLERPPMTLSGSPGERPGVDFLQQQIPQATPKLSVLA